MSRIMAVAEYYNEAKNIPELVDNLANQTCVPDFVLLIDDGSTDNSTELFKEGLEEHRISYKLYSMPKKKKPNANLKGRAFSEVDILNNDWVQSDPFDYLMLVGADTRFPKTYIELGVRIMDEFPEFGVLAGRIHGEPGSDTPMGTGKIVRWSVVKKTSGRYWDLDPDSLWNLIAINMGYRMLILRDVLVTVTRPTHMYNEYGFYNYGCRMYYAGWSFLSALIYSLVLLIRRQHAKHFLRGYLHTYRQGDWKCHDPAITNYYSFGRMMRRMLGLAHQRDVATIVKIGMTDQHEEAISRSFIKRVFSLIQSALAKEAD